MHSGCEGLTSHAQLKQLEGKSYLCPHCRGMPPETLSRVVMRVGESRKRGASFVNGQFGFGMQAFRAACSSLTVLSRTSAPSEAGGAAPRCG